MNNTYFVTGTDTDAGKTLATSALREVTYAAWVKVPPLPRRA